MPVVTPLKEITQILSETVGECNAAVIIEKLMIAIQNCTMTDFGGQAFSTWVSKFFFINGRDDGLLMLPEVSTVDAAPLVGGVEGIKKAETVRLSA